MKKQSKITQNLEDIAERIRFHLSDKDSVREKSLRICREIIRHSANIIRAVHRHEYAEAQKLLNTTSSLVMDLKNEITPVHSDIRFSGFVHDAQKEFAEAHIVFSILHRRILPDPDKIGVNYPAYLNGLGEAVGELRRFLLDSLRQNDFSRCEELLTLMDEIYTILVTIDFPDAITFGLRRTTDSVRGILEKTRGDLTIVLQQKQLEQKLKLLSNK